MGVLPGADLGPNPPSPTGLDPPGDAGDLPALRPLQHPDIVGRGGLPRMPGGPSAGRRGRRGRRTARMTRVASERVTDLFGLAEAESTRGADGYADRYVALARKVGMRYNVRLLPEYRELYCRGCSVYWVEGRTVRTRLRSGRRVRTCLECGRPRRVPIRARSSVSGAELPSPDPVLREDGALVDSPTVDDEEPESGDDS